MGGWVEEEEEDEEERLCERFLWDAHMKGGAGGWVGGWVGGLSSFYIYVLALDGRRSVGGWVGGWV